MCDCFKLNLGSFCHLMMNDWDSITLVGVQASALHASDFHFV